MADPITVTKLGPGTLKIGETGTELDLSCNASEVEFATDKEQDDPVPVLCGREVASPATYTATISGTLLLDLSDPDSIFYYADAHKGETVPVEFVPNTDAGATIAGNVTLDPLGISGDVRGNVESEFEWSFAEWPTITPPSDTPPATDPTGVTAGTPGSWTPGSATPPTTLAAANTLANSSGFTKPAAAWTTGQYVELGDVGDTHVYWNGSVFANGEAS